MTAISSEDGADATIVANERFKSAFGSWLWGSMIVATVLHFALFSLFPGMTAADISFAASEIEAIDLPPEITIPPPPERLARPATPVVSDVPISEDITMAETTFEKNPVSELPPPREPTRSEDVAAQPAFTPYTVSPKLLNRREVQDALVRNYPQTMREAGIGGRAILWFFIDDTGMVQDTRVYQSSGFEDLDQAATSVADVMRFTPAQNMDKFVPVWIQIPITFSIEMLR
jgi:TonB family protein